ncbi:hypothetical protein [Acinetobacter thermotolerans]|uniref:hypothetical protein n=1 Tax=Acinetobacter thermotolerans TaxID=3151487 RepID=UPI00325BC6F2
MRFIQKNLKQTALNKAKLTILAASITTLICNSVSASDIDIYTAPATAASATTMLFMLDTSGSMRFVDYASNSAGTSFSTHSPSSSTRSCPSGWSGSDKTITIGLTGASSKGTKSITVYECRYGSRPVTMHRLSKLKVGLLQVLLGDYSDLNNKIEPLADEVYIGLATFAGNKGQIRLAARQLSEVYTHNGVTQTHRRHLVDIVAGLTPNGGTPTPFAYAEAGAYLMGTRTNNTTYGNSTTNYTPPSSISAQKLNPNLKECSAQGIYFLTDGRPEPNTGSSTASSMMSSALSGNNSGWSCTATTSSKLGLRGGYYNSNHSWNCVGRFTQRLLDPDLNPAGIKIMTAVVGFGKDFDGSSPTNDVLDAMDWGILGEGGWYSGQNPEDIVESIQSFLGKIKTDIPGVSTGTATIPVDALNSSTIQPFGYFPQFVPKVAPTDLQQTWYGNLKKYHAVNGSLYGTKNGTQPVMQKDEIKNVADEWNNPNFTPNSNEVAFMHGALSQLIRGYRTTTTPKERLILSDFVYKDQAETKSLNLSTYDADAGKTIYQAISTSYNLTANAPYREALMNLLGYENAQAGVNLQNLATDAISKQVPQIGAILHSKPILLTQEGKPTVIKGADGKVLIDTTNRKDYILFGSTQGLLHVLDAKTGKEKFAFLPYEMIKKQSEAFKYNGGDTRGGKSNLHYGIDGEWTAHTTYVSKSDGTLSVDGGKRTIVNDDNKEEEINLKGKQWVYGGLRMGGRSYYALDLTNIDRPQVKFHIDPNTKKIYYLDKGITKVREVEELDKMGQSWSKPTLAYVNWRGKRKLVMFVGGGYDAGGPNGDGLYDASGNRNGYAGYETPTYDQDTATKKKIGAGVYMFDADDGDLLWSVSGNYSASKTGDRNVQLAGNGVGMDYSIVSSIKTVDRNNDGLVDHLYFGDLRGQAFRVDFNPSNTKFESQVTKILDLKSSKRRFYEQPTFTIHSQQGVATVSFASGDRSSPLYGKTDTVDSSLDYDGVFVIYDYDVYSSKYPTTHIAARTLGTTALGGHTKLRLLEKRVDPALASNKKPVIDTDKLKGDGGWYYLFNKEESLGSTAGTSTQTTKAKQILKSFAPLIAIENDLYVPTFDASKAGTTGSCSAGVAGETSIHRFCLPYGVCSENIYITLGAGIGEPLMGGGRDGDNSKRSLFVLNEDKKGGGGAGGTGGTTQIKNYGGALKFIPNRWYEQYAQGGG